MNRTILVGRLTKDPELRYTTNGIAVTSFTLAVNRNFKDSQGNQQTDFIRCVCWRKTAESTANYLKKGSLAGVDGKLQTRSYQDQSGKTVFITEVLAEAVQFLETKKNDSNRSEPPDQKLENEHQPMDDPFLDSGNPIDINDDDLPF